MVDLVKELANASRFTPEQLKNIAEECGYDWPIECWIPVGTLVQACVKYGTISQNDIKDVQSSSPG